MSGADSIGTYTFTRYFRTSDINNQQPVVTVFENSVCGESWKLQFHCPNNWQIAADSTATLTLTKKNDGDCSFFVKLLVLDENRQSKLELVKKGWLYVGSYQQFVIPNKSYFDIKNSTWAQLAVRMTITKIPKPSIADEMSTLFKSETFGDVEIECADGEKFHCHKDMLAAKSHHFATMFSLEMKESVENRVEIKDFNSDVISALLRFVYLGDWGDLSSVADRLYVAADRYELQQLKLASKAELIVSLKVDSIVPTLRLAHLYKDESLMAECVDFMAAHKDELDLVEVFDEATKK